MTWRDYKEADISRRDLDVAADWDLADLDDLDEDDEDDEEEDDADDFDNEALYEGLFFN